MCGWSSYNNAVIVIMTLKAWICGQSLIILRFIYYIFLRAGSSKSELAKICELRNKWIKNSKNVLFIKLFCFQSNFDETWWSWSTLIS